MSWPTALTPIKFYARKRDQIDPNRIKDRCPFSSIFIFFVDLFYGARSNSSKSRYLKPEKPSVVRRSVDLRGYMTWHVRFSSSTGTYPDVLWSISIRLYMMYTVYCKFRGEVRCMWNLVYLQMQEQTDYTYIRYTYVTHCTVYMYAIFTSSVHIVYSYLPGEDSEMRGTESNGASCA